MRARFSVVAAPHRGLWLERERRRERGGTGLGGGDAGLRAGLGGSDRPLRGGAWLEAWTQAGGGNPGGEVWRE